MMHKGIFFEACHFRRCSAAFLIALRRDVALQQSGCAWDSAHQFRAMPL